MDFELTEEHLELQRVVREVAERECPPTLVRAVLAGDDDLRRQTLVDGKRIVTGMIGCRLPVVAAVNGPAVGLGCSIVALSDIVYMAESAHLADPHVMIGLVAADGGPVTWPLLTSLQLAKEYALTGDRIPAERAAAIGLVNHVCPDDEDTWLKAYLYSRAQSVMGGTSQIQRNLVATRLLGLPTS